MILMHVTMMLKLIQMTVLVISVLVVVERMQVHIH